MRLDQKSGARGICLRAAIAMSALTAAALPHLPAMAATPTAFFDQSTLTGAGNTVTINRVPVQTSSGRIIYYDVTTQYSVDGSGHLTVAAGYPSITPSKTLLVGDFKAGNYIGPSTLGGGKYFAVLGGPGVGAGGATAWAFQASTGADCNTTPSSATWYTGAITSNPEYARLKAAGITSPVYSYGTSGNEPFDCGDSLHFYAGALIGAAQAGNTLTIVSFSSSYTGLDYATPQDQITYTLR